MRYSAGIIPFRLNSDNKMEFFVGHPGGDMWSNKNYWTFLKGGIENGEDWLTTAIREFQEESGYSLEKYCSSDFIPLGAVIQNPTKTVIAFGLYCPQIKENQCFSNMASNGLNPEIDRYKWLTFDEISYCTHKSHLILYEKLIKRFENEFKNY